MTDKYTIEPFGPPIREWKNSDLSEVTYSSLVLRAVVYLGENQEHEDRFLEIVFKGPRGFRYLDEGDLLPYWRSGTIDQSNHLVHEVKCGGWAEQEVRSGMLNVTDAVGLHREWLIVSDNGCLSVISTKEPVIRFL